jgi:hypothetical protein
LNNWIYFYPLTQSLRDRPADIRLAWLVSPSQNIDWRLN